jgi:hypothetical protein
MLDTTTEINPNTAGYVHLMSHTDDKEYQEWALDL